MSRLNTSVFTEPDYNIIAAFVALISSPGMKGRLVQHVQNTSQNARVGPTQPLELYLQDVIATNPRKMYKAGLSFMTLYTMVYDLGFRQDDLMPPESLVRELEEQFYNHLRDIANPPATDGQDSIRDS